MVEKVLLGVTATASAGVLVGQLAHAGALSDGLAVLAVASLSACLAFPRRRGGAEPGA